MEMGDMYDWWRHQLSSGSDTRHNLWNQGGDNCPKIRLGITRSYDTLKPKVTSINKGTKRPDFEYKHEPVDMSSPTVRPKGWGKATKIPPKIGVIFAVFGDFSLHLWWNW